jgi:hypothetical protein
MGKRLQLFFTYFGGKWRIAKHYPAPEYASVIEPFAGSAGYSLHYPHKQVFLYDINPIICAVWDYLIHVSAADILKLPDAVEDVRTLPSHISQEARWLIGFWLNKGMISPCNIPGKWMRDHLRIGQRLNSYWGAGIKQRIASQLEHIRHWKVQEGCYSDIQNDCATWFIDPPYELSGKKYPHSDIDYGHLAEWCQARNGQAIVCEQGNASWLPFGHFREIKTLEGRKRSKRGSEVAWFKP